MRFTSKIEKEVIYDMAAFSIGIAIISFFWRDNLLLLSLLALACLIGMKSWYRKHDIYFFVAGAIVGPAAEIVCVHFGTWQYTNPTLLGIPVWLPLAWGLAVMLIKRIAGTFVKIELK